MIQAAEGGEKGHIFNKTGSNNTSHIQPLFLIQILQLKPLPLSDQTVFSNITLARPQTYFSQGT